MVIVGILSAISLFCREDVRIVDPVLAALVEVGAAEHVDEHLVERVGEARLVDQRCCVIVLVQLAVWFVFGRSQSVRA